jgi:hypothetical protein
MLSFALSLSLSVIFISILIVIMILEACATSADPFFRSHSSVHIRAGHRYSYYHSHSCVCLIVFLHHSFCAGSSRARCLKLLSSTFLGEVFLLRFKSFFPLEDCFRAFRARRALSGSEGPSGPTRALFLPKESKI